MTSKRTTARLSVYTLYNNEYSFTKKSHLFGLNFYLKKICRNKHFLNVSQSSLPKQQSTNIKKDILSCNTNKSRVKNFELFRNGRKLY